MCNTRIPIQERGINTKNQIIEAAMTLFSKKRMKDVTTKEIAVKAGVSIGSFYSYFSDKDAVFLEVLKDYNNKYNKAIKSVFLTLNDVYIDEKLFLHNFITTIIDFHKDNVEFYKDVMIMKLTDSRVASIMKEHYKSNLSSAKNYMEYCKERIVVEDITAATEITFLTLRNTIDLIMFSESSLSIEQLINETINMVSAYLFGNKKVPKTTTM